MEPLFLRPIVAMCPLLILASCALEGGGQPRPDAVTAATKIALRVNCGADAPYTDRAGNQWIPDQSLAPGRRWGHVEGLAVDRGRTREIPGTPAPRVYQTERYLMTAYQFNLPPGKYTIRLHFAETYHGITAPGQRLYTISLNGKPHLPDFDPFKEAGGPNKPFVKEFRGIVVQGAPLVLGFTPNVQNPEINGIEILAE